MRHLLIVGHLGVALLWRKPQTRNLNDSRHTPKGLSVHHRQRLSKEGASCLIDCPVLSLMEYFSVIHSAEQICRDALASCGIISFQGSWSYKVIGIQIEGFALVVQTS